MPRFFARLRRWIPNIYMMLVMGLLYLPIVVVVAYSFNASSNGINWTGFSTQWYGKLMTNFNILDSLRNSLIVAFWSCAIAAVIGTLGAVGMARVKLRGSALVEGLASLPIMVPEIILGMAFMVSFSLAKLPAGVVTLVLAHATFCIPYVLIIVRSRLVGLSPSYEEAARDLGAGAARAFMTVTVPLILPAILSGVLLAFAMSLDDMVISFFVTGPEVKTLPVYIYGKLKTRITPEINALCTLMLGVTFIAVALSQYGRARKAGQE